MYSVKTLQLSAVDIGERYSNVAHTQDVQQSIFLALQIMGGHILLPLIIVTSIFSKSTPRHPVFLNFCFSWSLSSFIYSMIIYSKRTISESLSLHPGPSVCLVQAALINGIQAMTSSTTLALSAHIWDIFRQSRRNALPADYILNYGIRNTSLLVVPLVVFLAFATATTVIGNVPAIHDGDNYRPNLAVPTTFYCVIVESGGKFSLFRGVYMFSVIVTLAAIVFKGLTMFEIYHTKKSMSQCMSRGVSVIFARLVVFSVFRALTLGFDLATAIKPSSIPPSRRGGDFTFESGIDLLEAGLPLVAGIILGTQKDFLNVWFFWKRRDTSKEPA